MRYTLFADHEDLRSAGVEYTAYPSTLGLEVILTGWKLKPSHALRLHLGLSIQPPVTSSARNDIRPGITAFMMQSSDVLTTSLHVLNFVVVDNLKNMPIGFSIRNTHTPSHELVVAFPPFKESLHFYLPHISVVLHEDTRPTENNPQGGITELEWWCAMVLMGSVGVLASWALWRILRTGKQEKKD